MNAWLAAAAALALGLVPCLISALREDLLNRIMAFELAGILATLILLLLAEGTQRPSFFDLSITLALLSSPGTLIFVKLLGDAEVNKTSDGNE